MSARGKLFQRFYSWHRYLGLFLALHLVLLILTGMLLTLRDELQSSDEVLASESVRAESPKISLDELVTRAKAKEPAGLPLAINFDDDNPDRLTVRLGKDGSPLFRGSSKHNFDRFTGEIPTHAPAGGFWDFILRFHREFLLGFYGKLYVGLIGFLLLVSLVSGVYLYAPTSLRRSFGSIRRNRLTFTLSDIHKLFGMTVFVWLLLIGFTGTMLATSGQLLKLYQYTELNALKAQFSSSPVKDPISVDTAFAAAISEAPDKEVAFITFPATEFSTTGHYIFVLNGKEGFDKYLSEIVLIDARDGSRATTRQLPWYLKAALLSEPLHFGNYGGLPLKLIWVGFSLLALVLTISGPALWYMRKRKVKGPDKIKSGVTRSSENKYLYPVPIGTLILGGSLLAISSNPWIDRIACLLLLIPLFIIVQKLFAASDYSHRSNLRNR
ncbi:MAG: PepSY-associated TM helix domain-containing protein [Bdellovibrionota bacterium]